MLSPFKPLPGGRNLDLRDVFNETGFMQRLTRFAGSKPWVRILLIGLSAVAASTALASLPPNVSKSEMDSIPEYCPHTMGFNYKQSSPSPKAPYWIAVMGSNNLWTVHHYCWALINLRRAENKALSAQVRGGLLNEAIGDIYWTLEHCDRDFVLLPEIYTRLGDAELMCSNTGAAYDAYLRARQLKPDYWPAYSNWAAALIKVGLKNDARKLVQEGLMQVPDSKVLLDQYKLLGGDPAQIKPQAKAPGAVDLSTSTDTSRDASAAKSPAQ